MIKENFQTKEKHTHTNTISTQKKKNRQDQKIKSPHHIIVKMLSICNNRALNAVRQKKKKKTQEIYKGKLSK